MELAKMTSKGQLTVPVSIRRMLGIDTGDQILFYVKNGHIIIDKESPASLGDAQIAAAENHIYSLEEIKAIAAPIAKKYKVESMRLFGSYARNEATPKSDLDFVIAKGGIRTLLDLSGLEQELSENFHKKVDILTDNSLKPEFRNKIKKDEVMIYDSKQGR